MEAPAAISVPFFVELYHPGRQGMSMFNGNWKMPAPQCPIEGVRASMSRSTRCPWRTSPTRSEKYVDGAVRAARRPGWTA